MDEPAYFGRLRERAMPITAMITATTTMQHSNAKLFLSRPMTEWYMR